jgi:hypothetical protein
MRTFILSAAVLVLVVIAACGRGTPDARTPEHTQVPAATIKDLMLSIIDTNADIVWQSVSAVSDAEGTTETRPRNDEEWAKVRFGALALAESANLLLVPGRRVARLGEVSEVPGIELEPEEMDALIARDPAAFHQHAVALRQAALEVLTAVDNKDADKVFEIGEHIELACEGCHSQFWYPNEKVPTLTISADTRHEPASKN